LIWIFLALVIILLIAYMVICAIDWFDFSFEIFGFYFIVIATLCGICVIGLLKSTENADIPTGTSQITDYCVKNNDGKKTIEYRVGNEIFTINAQSKSKKIVIDNDTPTQVTISKEEHFDICFFTTENTYTYVFK
jgi:hypothetical protein